jgi:DNA-binding LytR/AlgR family response regulator
VQAVPGLRFTALAAGLVVIAAVYCLAHGLVLDDEINLPRTLAWAVVSTFPWVCAWEGLQRLGARSAQRLQPLPSAAVLVAALVVSVALEYVLGAIYSAHADSLAQIVYRLLPIPLGIAVARRRMLRRPSAVLAGTESPTERLRDLQVERVYAIPTRNGTFAVRAADIEYVKAAGNYVELITGERTLLMRATLHDLGEQLGAVGFVRVHRSLLVNSLQVLAVRRGPRGRQLVKLSSGAELPVGRQFDANTRAFVTIAQRSSLRS